MVRICTSYGSARSTLNQPPLSSDAQMVQIFYMEKHTLHSTAPNNSFYDLTLMTVDQEIGRLIVALKRLEYMIVLYLL